MKIQKITAFLGALALSIGFASSATALSVNLGTGVDVQTSVGSSVSVNASSSDSANPGDTAEGNTSASANLEPLFVTQADLSAGMVAPTTDDATSVQSSTDLSGYVAARLQDDNNISQIQASGTNVAVTYTEPAKILGIFPVNIDATATINGDGSVDVSYPWYAFVFKTDASNLQAKIQDRVKADLGANFSAQASVGFSAHQQAQLISDISAVMQGEANASASGSTNVQ